MMIDRVLRCHKLDLVTETALDARPLLSAQRTQVRHCAMSEMCQHATSRKKSPGVEAEAFVIAGSEPDLLPWLHATRRLSN